MLTFTMSQYTASTTPEPTPIEPGVGRAAVRVLWGKALGSTYQRYYPRIQTSRTVTSVKSLGSMFSRPLTCPDCRGAFELRQVEGESPDTLEGNCSCCHASARLTVGDEGRLTVIESSTDSLIRRTARN